ncbi:SRPBCC domain-containing protein [Isoptericola halotolerans]|uniref:SRPBCC family protein n=1 Tax=Isoptericola halotolerans TaxID=300560 RepID=UPI00389099E0
MTAIVDRDHANKQLTVQRSVRGAAALVWSCWTEPGHLRQWWGPRGWRSDHFELELRPGGVWRYRLRPAREHGADEEHWGRAVYDVVDPYSSLSFLDGSCSPHGTPIPGTEQPTHVSIKESAPRRCEVRIVVRFPSVHALEQAEPTGMVDGFIGALARLDEYVRPGSGKARS